MYCWGKSGRFRTPRRGVQTKGGIYWFFEDSNPTITIQIQPVVVDERTRFRKKESNLFSLFSRGPTSTKIILSTSTRKQYLTRQNLKRAAEKKNIEFYFILYLIKNLKNQKKTKNAENIKAFKNHKVPYVKYQQTVEQIVPARRIISLLQNPWRLPK